MGYMWYFIVLIFKKGINKTMAAFLIEKTKDYTVMTNHQLRNTALSLKAKGILSLMLSLPEDLGLYHKEPYPDMQEWCG